MYQKGMAEVSLRVSPWDWRDPWKKKVEFHHQRQHINELIVFQDIARYRLW